MSIAISVKHPVIYVNKKMLSKLPISAWGDAILHAASLIHIRSISYHKFSQLQMVFGQEPNICHLRNFLCVIETG